MSLESKNNQSCNHLNVLLCIIVGFVVLKLPWFLDLLIKYPRFEFETSGFLLLPLILLPLSIPIAIYLLKMKPKLTITYLIVIGLSFVLMIIIELSFILYLQRFIPSNPTDIPSGFTIPSIWLSNEIIPMTIVTLWFFNSLLFLLPASVAIIIKTTNTTQQWTQTGHLSIAIIATVFALREWLYVENGIYYLLFGLILIPFMIFHLISESSNIKMTSLNVEKRIQIFQPTIAILFFIGFWWVILEAQATGRMDESSLWAIPAIGSWILYILEQNKSMSEYIASKRRFIIIISWCIMFGATVLYISGFLFAIINQHNTIFLAVGSIFLILLPEYLISGTPRIKKFFKIPRQLIVGFSFLIGLLIAFIVNIEDPISSYIVILLAIGGLFIGLLELIPKKNKNNPINEVS